ncbi:nickel pincer cofactor biosynthesis protein LarB [Desulfatitalea alkaliphila]|uniref:Nickel pincer cofactor biosynthesis protein LarB n=1 Tax=Desulfatitalea alkaliphila TaxID=2929485 RepID=A0AA41R1M8_9BACT|nr:nickel pincer cofactor biosynthesis protein LarB [Desulfatitalea alkaliphila]MCJ8501272.1 nickel pincer cofactor biosynthesis protein LarB [Desulfatitalea alkaliphila]
MNKDILTDILKAVADGGLDIDAARQRLADMAMEDIDFAHIDHHRSLRKGFPEVIFGEGKSAAQIVGIMERMQLQEQVLLVTRVDAVKAAAVLERFAEARYDTEARMIVWQRAPLPKTGLGTILVVSAGTSDIPVAREACLTADAMGNVVKSVFDVGVAGIHRLMAHRSLLEEARVLIVVAGMEGALPSVVAGMVSRPVIAVPTSVGYGVNLGGLTALFGMLTSCSSNVAVVNIDNGFGAGYMAASINQP